MHSIRPPRVSAQCGMTLIEMSVVITVLLSLVSILFMATQSWKRGSDRAACIVTLRNVQVAVRSYQNLYGYTNGGYPYAEYGTQDIARHLMEKGYLENSLYQLATGQKNCYGGGTYERRHPDVFPVMGALYVQCSLSSSADHFPTKTAEW
jgi:prepilin-type N-terminal cleavage/methylation domain-containing protein